MQLPFQSPTDGVLLVTGAARGIGAACAKLGALAGYPVVVNYARSFESDIRSSCGRDD